MLENLVWAEKYRPHTVADTVLPDALKAGFQKFVDQKHVPNMLLCGGPGVGKTTVAKAMLDELGCDYIVINGSMNGNIDTLRTEILNFASTVSFMGGRKYVILDEADYLNANSTQPALRNFMEEFSANCGFILTCNYKDKIIKALHSRCPPVEFKIQKSDLPKLAMQLMKRVIYILTAENVPFDKAVVAAVIQKHFPDCRRVINELQRYSATGAIDAGILTNFEQLQIIDVLKACKNRSYDDVRVWVHEHSDRDTTEVFRAVFDASKAHIKAESLPEMVVIIADYQHKAAFAADHELNMLAFFVELMMRVEWQ